MYAWAWVDLRVCRRGRTGSCGLGLAVVSLARTVPQLLTEQLATDPTRPLVTYYDDAAGERIELSVVSFENAVAKTANLLHGELGADPGDRVALLLPPHWQGAVWAVAVACCAGRLVADPSEAEVVVCGPDTLDEAVAAGAREVVAMALRPLGGAFPTPLPAGVLDHGVEVPAQSDRFLAIDPPTPETPFLADESHGAVLDRARDSAHDLGLADGGRLMTDLSPADPDGLVDGLLAALASSGSVVLVRNLDPAAVAKRAEQEQVTTTRWQRG